MTRQTDVLPAVSAVLAAAADEVERWPDHHATRELRAGAGGAIFCLLYETAKQMYGWAAIEHMEKVLGAGQIQHWRETDRVAVAKALREAAGIEPAPDVEVQAVRAKLTAFHTRLAEAMGWLGYDVTTLVAQVGDEMGRLRDENEKLKRQVADMANAARTANPT